MTFRGTLAGGGAGIRPLLVRFGGGAKVDGSLSEERGAETWFARDSASCLDLFPGIMAFYGQVSAMTGPDVSAVKSDQLSCSGSRDQ